jgi:predicted RND superfamily exporter protein
MVMHKMRDVALVDLARIMAIVTIGVGASLLWSFKDVRWFLAPLLPVLASVAVLLAVLLLIPHRLNYVNILVLPVIVGIGIDDGIHIIYSFRRSGRVREIITETGRAIMMTSLTTIIGFGSLMGSRYRGLASMGFVAALGMFLCLCASLVMLPALLAVLESRRRTVSPYGGECPIGMGEDDDGEREADGARARDGADQ